LRHCIAKLHIRSYHPANSVYALKIHTIEQFVHFKSKLANDPFVKLFVLQESCSGLAWPLLVLWSEKDEQFAPGLMYRCFRRNSWCLPCDPAEDTLGSRNILKELPTE